ncbi:MAG TPA: hypothetical protein VE093_46995 [Polyangiaceae bacterium]|jgi:hypothetical protein|nr:hypothetical protein [Polyangiaceae bacterium]
MRYHVPAKEGDHESRAEEKPEHPLHPTQRLAVAPGLDLEELAEAVQDGVHVLDGEQDGCKGSSGEMLR